MNKSAIIELKGKRAAITGSTGGLGRELCFKLASFGANECFCFFIRSGALPEASSFSLMLVIFFTEVCIRASLEHPEVLDKVCLHK